MDTRDNARLATARNGQPLALELIDLSKTFGETVAVDHINLSVPRGSFFGLVGPNGAGKTTALSMAVGLLRPDSGRARILGVDVWDEPIQAKTLIGVLPDGMALPERLTGREALMYLGLLRGMDEATVRQRAGELLNVLELDRNEHTLVIEYSAGMRKKIGLAMAVLHNPRLLILDEPFEAVDPISASTVRVILQRYVAAGGTVILSSHVMALVEQICDHVAIIARGRIVAAGPLDEVRGGDSLEDRFVELVGAQIAGGEGLSWLAT
ncbi:MAG: ABC transporter ATP-binding protein [Chloroflexi bacterium]|nr:ABC transporter ATP-binding protein [Chloroflexota bacterium]